MPRSIGKTDIRFDEPRLNRLMAHVNRLTEEVQAIEQMLDDGTSGQVLIKRSGRDFDAQWGDVGDIGGGGSEGESGEANTAANVGSGAGIFLDKSGVTLNLRSLVNGSGINITVEGDVIRITNTEASDEIEPMMIAGVY